MLSPYEQTQLAKYGVSPKAIKGATPIEYFTGKVTFCGLELLVNPAVLIPRVETEGLVELALQILSELLAQIEPNETLKTLEVGTGSGAITIALDQHLSQAGITYQLTATDISKAAVSVAQSNAQQLTNQQPFFITSDLLAKVTGQYHLIIANLPYIPSDRIKELDASVKDFEPHLALDGGSNGFSLIKLLLDQAVDHLLPNGHVLLEVDQTHTQNFFDQYTQQFTITYFTDCFDRHRFVRLDLKKP